MLTFAVSGALHDLAVSLVKWQLTFLFTLWFVMMAGLVLVAKQLAVSTRDYHWLIRITVNLALIAGSFILVATV